MDYTGVDMQAAEAKDRYTTLTAERDALREQVPGLQRLEQYVRHFEGCLANDDYETARGPCDCGLDAALASKA